MTTFMTGTTGWRALGILALVAFLFISASVTTSRGQDASARFPDPARVTADYPDDAQRYAAFTVLAEAMAQAASKPISKADYAKINAYQGGRQYRLVAGIDGHRPEHPCL